MRDLRFSNKKEESSRSIQMCSDGLVKLRL